MRSFTGNNSSFPFSSLFKTYPKEKRWGRVDNGTIVIIQYFYHSMPEFINCTLA